MKKLFALLTILLLLTGIPVTAHAQVQHDVAVSAVVPPSAGDYQFDFTTDGQTTVSQNNILTYHITYGTQASAGVDTPTTLVVHFNEGLAPGGSNIVDYVIGSATSAYGGITPVVNLSNRTITWSIPSLPAGTVNQTVNFQLKTNENYTGNASVGFSTSASMSNQYVSMPDQTVAQTYKYTILPATSTHTPTGSSTPAPTVTPPSSSSVSPLQLRDMSFTNISSSTATITIITAVPVTTVMRYGTSPTNLNQSVQTTKRATKTSITLQNLKPNTTYYFQIIETDAAGLHYYSEIFSFNTAKESSLPSLDQSIFIMTSGNNIMISNIYQGKSQKFPTALMMKDSTFALQIKLSRTIAVKSIVAIISPKVLGANTFTQTATGLNTITIPLREGEPGGYNANITTPNQTGIYEVFIKVVDKNGNVIQNKMAELKVMQLLTVLDSKTHQPISDARVLFSSFDPALGKFQILPEAFAPGLRNPSYTDANGEFPILLSMGPYQAQISAWSHRTATVTFTLGPKDGQEFPTVLLQNDPFDLTSLISFIHDWVIYLWDTGVTIANELAQSAQLFDLLALVAISSLVTVSYLLFSIRTQIKLTHLLPFVLFTLAVARNKHKETYISGMIQTKEKEPVGLVTIEILDPKTRTVLMHTQTTAAGTFHIPNRFETAAIVLFITKDGHAPQEHTIETAVKEPLAITIQRHEHYTPVVVQEVEHIAGSFFEVSLLFGLVLELMFFATFGPLKTLPFIVLTLLNILLWIFYREEHTHL